MTFALARAKLVDIVAGTTPTTTTLYQGAFVHLPEGASVDNPPSRSFWLECGFEGDTAIVGPFTPDLSGQPRVSTTCVLVVSYRDFSQKGADVEANLMDDYLDVTKRLLTPSLWVSATTGLTSITSNPAFAPMRRVRPRAGVIEQRTTFDMLFR